MRLFDTFRITGTFSLDEQSVAALEEWMKPDPEREAATLRRILEASRLAGMEVVHDLTMFEIEWSPVYHHEHGDKPIAWVNAAGDRREGAEYPGENEAEPRKNAP